MTTNSMKNKDLYFYLYMVLPLLLPVAYFFTMNDKAAFAVFYVVAIVCVVFDQKEMVKSGYESEPQFVGSALGILVFPPIYVYGRAKAAGMKKSRRWVWFFAYIAIALDCTFATIAIDDDESLKTSACEITTTIFKDKGSNVKCLVVQDVKKVSDKNYRAKAVLSNGIDMPITIEQRDNNYIYVTLAPLSGLLE
ncbi:hypothetical protein RZO86_11570 [Citrobacter braakii]|nr:hypothetical protein [Citrobacter braakii]MEB0651111.1 hypothetical protein [Citrobacter braakii]